MRDKKDKPWKAEYREKLVSADAVSYTHLDVYKRQLSGRPGGPVPLRREREVLAC